MANIIDQLEQIEKDIAGIKSKIDKATGRYEAAMAALASLGYDSIEAAETAIADKEDKLNKRKERLDAEFAAFLEEYQEVFEDEQ